MPLSKARKIALYSKAWRQTYRSTRRFKRFDRRRFWLRLTSADDCKPNANELDCPNPIWPGNAASVRLPSCDSNGGIMFLPGYRFANWHDAWEWNLDTWQD